MAFSKLDWQETILRGAGKDLTHAEMRILMTMSTYADSKDGGRIHPGKKRLAADINCSRTTLDEGIRNLVERGYLRLVQAGGNQVRRGFANVYQLSYPRWVIEGDTSPPTTGPLQFPQDPQSVDQAPQSLDTSPPVSGHEAPQSLGSHPVIDPVIYPVNMGALNSARLSDTKKNNRPFNLSEDARADLIACIQHTAQRLGPGYSSEEYDDAQADLLEHIDNYIGEEARELWEHEWKVAMPQIEAAGAEQKLDQFIGHCIVTGYPIAAMQRKVS